VAAVAAAAVAAAAAATAAMAAAAAYCRGCLLFIVKIFLCGVFMLGRIGKAGHTSPHTLITLEVRYVGVLLGGDSLKNCGMKTPKIILQKSMATKAGNILLKF
jgi:hypothetical protein